jgi:hypothetical protein
MRHPPLIRRTAETLGAASPGHSDIGAIAAVDELTPDCVAAREVALADSSRPHGRAALAANRRMAGASVGPSSYATYAVDHKRLAPTVDRRPSMKRVARPTRQRIRGLV